MFDRVVVSAEGGQVAFCGGSSVVPGLVVVDVAFPCGHSTSGEDTGPGFGFDGSFHGGGGSSSGGPVGYDRSVVIGDGVLPLGIMLVCGDLAGDVGYDWSPSGYLTGIVV
jgi:hypothetical protein